MKALLSLLLLLPMLSLAADSTIHGLPLRAAPTTNDMLVVDWQSGAAWYNAKIPLASLQQFMGGTPTNYTSTIYTTNAQVLYLTNDYTLTTNIYATNAYIVYLTNQYMNVFTVYATNAWLEYVTNNYLVTTNLWVTNQYVNYFTNNYAYITNLYATNEYVNFFTNNWMVTTNLFVTNEYVNFFTNNYAYITNLYATNTYLEYLTNNYQITTNLYVTNAYVQNFTNTYSYITNLTASTILFPTNSWAGPTNDINLQLADQYYATWTPCSITGVTNKPTTASASVLLTITNKATTNITLQLPNGFTTGDGAKSYTITNATCDVISMRYSPVGQTNAVFRAFW